MLIQGVIAIQMFVFITDGRVKYFQLSYSISVLHLPEQMD